MVIDPCAVQAALEKLRKDPEPEARFMRTTEGKRPAYNVQTAVDAECGIIVAQEVTTESNGHAQSVAHGGSGQAGGGRSGVAARGGGYGLLEWRAGGGMRGAGDRAACVG